MYFNNLLNAGHADEAGNSMVNVDNSITSEGSEEVAQQLITGTVVEIDCWSRWEILKQYVELSIR